MTSQSTSIIERLSAAESPQSLQDWKKKDAYYIATCGVSRDDVPHLIDIACKWSDPDWLGDDVGLDDHEDDGDLLPVSAWRALGELQAAESVQPLINMLCELDDEWDDWTSTELPHVFGKIGKPAIGALVQLAKDADKQDSIRSIAAEGLQRIAEYHPETRDEVVACLAEMMTNAAPDSIQFNSTLLDGLVELRAVEAAEAIERAFANDRLDVGMIGDWDVVRRKLGVEGLGLEMPKHPHNTIEGFRRRMGIGIFSDQPIFDNGEPNSDAEQAYYEQAWNLFSRSAEAEQVADRGDVQGWFQMLLEFGINYRGEVVDEMTLGSVNEFVLDYMPRKVSTEPEQAESIVFELTMFWEYLDRVYELPEAKPIIEWLKMDGLAASLKAELSNTANYGMAKSMFMSGKNAGYDMTSEEGVAEFMAAYNQSIMQNRSRGTGLQPVSGLGTGSMSPEPKVASTPTTKVAGRQRIGRNDPCPCGSGKKFKKCCRS